LVEDAMSEGTKVDLVLHDVDESVLRGLEAAAASHGRSLEEESIAILERAVRRSREAFIEESRRLQSEMEGRTWRSSAQVVRDMRDERSQRLTGHG
jgi:plasmid stability protein